MLRAEFLVGNYSDAIGDFDPTALHNLVSSPANIGTVVASLVRDVKALSTSTRPVVGILNTLSQLDMPYRIGSKRRGAYPTASAEGTCVSSAETTHSRRAASGSRAAFDG